LPTWTGPLLPGPTHGAGPEASGAAAVPAAARSFSNAAFSSAASSSAASSSSPQPPGALQTVQSALAAEHAAVFGYGVVGGKLPENARGRARTAYDAHRSRRDVLERTVRDLGGDPVAAAPAYALPFPVADTAAVVRLAAEIEDRVAAVYADMVGGTAGGVRADAAAALREAAVRAVGWRGSGVAFPGLPERAAKPSAQDSKAGSPDVS
jgi:Domain of unknown function (DUF4439)